MIKTQHKIKIIAHRGNTAAYPENTLEAFEAANLAGADGIELDVHATRDGELVVHHDYYLGNPDNGTGRIDQLPYSYLQNLTIKNKYSIPKLSSVFDKLGKKLHYEIEIKAFSTEAFEQVIALARSYNLLDKIESTSPHPLALSAFKHRHPSLTIGLFAPPQPTWMDPMLYTDILIADAIEGGFDVIHCSIGAITPKLIKIAHREHLLVHAADCDTLAELTKARQLAVDQVSTSALQLALSSSAD